MILKFAISCAATLQLGKMMILGAGFSCLDPILSVVTSLEHKSPFVVTSKSRELAVAVDRLSGETASDHLAQANVMAAWDGLNSRGGQAKTCGIQVNTAFETWQLKQLCTMYILIRILPMITFYLREPYGPWTKQRTNWRKSFTKSILSKLQILRFVNNKIPHYTLFMNIELPQHPGPWCQHFWPRTGHNPTEYPKWRPYRTRNIRISDIRYITTTLFRK